MSKIVTPYPPKQLDSDSKFPAEAGWWRLILRPGENGDLYTMRSIPEEGEPRAFEVEFYDGYNTIIDCGFDRPTRAIITNPSIVDVLSIGPPTPCNRWWRLTVPGDHRYPGDPEPK